MTGRWMIATILVVAGCSSTGISIPDDIGAGFDLDAMLEEARDCGALVDGFVDVSGAAADQIDALSERLDGRVPATELREKVDAIAVSDLFGLAERIGCDRVELELDTVDRLRDLRPQTEDGTDFIAILVEELESRAGV